MLLSFGAIFAGLALLVWSAEKFVDGSATTARYAGLPPIIIGMVIVGFGTSAPEMIVSAMSAVDGNSDLALGNAYGSNIVNITIILGVTALISPILVKSSIVKKEIPLLLVIVIGCSILLIDNAISITDALLLQAAFLMFFSWTVVSGIKYSKKEAQYETSATEPPTSIVKAIFWLISGLALLLLSSKMLVWGAVELARTLGVTDLVIGLTVVAFGTSLPELAASVIAAKKGQHDIVIGNIIGSNIFNALAVVGIAGVIQPIQSLAPALLYRDCGIMILTTILLLIMSLSIKGQGVITRFKGVLLIATYFCYTIYLIQTMA